MRNCTSTHSDTNKLINYQTTHRNKNTHKPIRNEAQMTSSMARRPARHATNNENIFVNINEVTINQQVTDQPNQPIQPVTNPTQPSSNQLTNAIHDQPPNRRSHSTDGIG